MRRPVHGPANIVEQDTDGNIVELMEVETAPFHNVIAFFPEGSIACPVFGIAQELDLLILMLTVRCRILFCTTCPAAVIWVRV
jgi:hypothetical protein